jgi:hypothetical protein
MFGGTEFPGGSGLLAGPHGGIRSASPNSRTRPAATSSEAVAAQARAIASRRDGASARHRSSAQRQSFESSNMIRIAAPRPRTAE